MATIKRQNFVRLAEARVNKAIKSIQVVANLSNSGNYDYTEEDVRLIINALTKESTDLKSRFKNEGSNSSNEFKLKI